MTNKPGRKGKRTNKLRGKHTWDLHGQFQKVCIIAPTACYSGLTYFQLKKKSYDRCPSPVYF